MRNRQRALILLLVALLLAGSLVACDDPGGPHSYSTSDEVEAWSIFVATRAAVEGAPLVVGTPGP